MKKRRTMTVARLAKLLNQAVADGLGRSAVCIDKRTFIHPLESDGACILDVYDGKDESILQIDDDGGTKTDSKGRECHRRCFVLGGWENKP